MFYIPDIRISAVIIISLKAPKPDKHITVNIVQPVGKLKKRGRPSSW